MIKIAHESPNKLFKEVQKLTDYDYALVHLFEENEEYLNNFLEAKKNGREIILDNSIFELEEAYNPEDFLHWINELEPDWYIVPDVLEDYEGTIKNMEIWNKEFQPRVNSFSKKIGVVQGKKFSELVDCYRYMNTVAKVDMIAISFDYSYYTKYTSEYSSNTKVKWMLGRVALLGKLYELGVINTDKPHHLLGVALPQEGSYYREEGYDWIYSMDTSNPVVHGLKNIRYTKEGLWSKESTKLHTLIESEPENIEIVKANIRDFRAFWNKDCNFN